MLVAEATEKIGVKYVNALRAQFEAAILEESWQAPDQVTLTGGTELPAGDRGDRLLPAWGLACDRGR